MKWSFPVLVSTENYGSDFMFDTEIHYVGGTVMQIGIYP